MLSNLTTEQILDLAYTKGTTFDVIAFAEKVAELEREATIALIRQTLQGDGSGLGCLRRF